MTVGEKKGMALGNDAHCEIKVAKKTEKLTFDTAWGEEELSEEKIDPIDFFQFGVNPETYLC